MAPTGLMTLDFAEHLILGCGSRTYNNPREIRVQLEMLPERTWIVHETEGAGLEVQEMAFLTGHPTLGLPTMEWTPNVLEEFEPEACLAFGWERMVYHVKETELPVRVFGKRAKLRQLIGWRKEGII